MLRRVHPGYPEYGPLTASACTAWRDLEAEEGSALFVGTGGLLVGTAGSSALSAATKAADGIAHRRLSTAELRTAYPALHVTDDAEGLLDEEAGILLAEPCVRAFRRRAEHAGAELRFGAAVDLHDMLTRWPRDHVLDVGGDRVSARLLVIALGPWLRSVPLGYRWPDVTIERTVSHWLDPGEHLAALAPDRTPFVTWDDPRGEFRMAPALPGGVKVESHRRGEDTDPDTGPRAVADTECEAAQARLAELAGLKLAHRAACAQMYTNTRDGRFVVTRHPWAEDIVVVSACSGHGFMFAPVVADRVTVAAGT